ncbi:MAG TPA: S8 family serine peptidase [Thermoanaerobaculia bacterium]|jgi:hypothetical protein|nr:S8 family serine peptidase [Thermoanaerobaculia bacterium]
MSRFVWRVTQPEALASDASVEQYNKNLLTEFGMSRVERGPQAVFRDLGRVLSQRFAQQLSALPTEVGKPHEYFEAWITEPDLFAAFLGAKRITGMRVDSRPKDRRALVDAIRQGVWRLSDSIVSTLVPRSLVSSSSPQFAVQLATDRVVAPALPMVIETASSSFCTEPTPVTTARRFLVPRQRYLFGVDDTAHGLDVTEAWKYVGGFGESVTVLDLESGSTPHESLGGEAAPRVRRLRPGNDRDPHGTAVQSLICGRPVRVESTKELVGMVGIAPAASVLFSSVNETDHGLPFLDHPFALVDAIERGELAAGDVVVIEINIRQNGLIDEMPIETYFDGWLASWIAFQNGIHVVTAAGNSGIPLQRAADRDNGAIVVGAAFPSGRRLSPTFHFQSNHGGRVDLHAWGTCVVSAGGKGSPFESLQSSDLGAESYTFFDGTSAAAALVVAAVASLSGILKANSIPQNADTVLAVRRCLQLGGTPPPTGGPTDLGNMINMKGAIAKLKEAFPDAAFAQHNDLKDLPANEVAATVAQRAADGLL